MANIFWTVHTHKKCRKILKIPFDHYLDQCIRNNVADNSFSHRTVWFFFCWHWNTRVRYLPNANMYGASRIVRRHININMAGVILKPHKKEHILWWKWMRLIHGSLYSAIVVCVCAWLRPNWNSNRKQQLSDFIAAIGIFLHKDSILVKDQRERVFPLPPNGMPAHVCYHLSISFDILVYLFVGTIENLKRASNQYQHFDSYIGW